MTLRVEDGPLLRGERRYVDDLAGGHLRATFVRSTDAAGRIRSIDVAEAAAAPGVVAVLTADDLPLGGIRGHAGLDERFSRPPLATGEVRFVGEPVAVVIAETRAQAVDAAELVVVDVEPRPAVLLGDEAAEVAWEAGGGNEGAVLEGAEVVVRGRFVNQRVASAPLEPDGALAEPDPETGGVVLWASTQRVHHVRDAVAASLGLDPALVRVRAPQVGGGFGGKFEPSPEAVVVAAAALRLGRAVAWTQTRTENLLCMPHGRGQVQEAALGLKRDGTFVGIWADLTADAGAYPTVGALIPGATLAMLPGPYRFERAGGRARAVVTNTTPVGAYRGAGRPEATALLERLVDLAAAELGLDPAELRRRNLIPADAYPFTSATGMPYDSGDPAACLAGALEAIGYDEVRARQAAGAPLGVGIGMWMDCTPMNRPGEWASVEVVPDGEDVRLVVRDGANDQGQAHATTWGLLLQERLGIPVEAVELHHGDTAHVPSGEGTGSARSLMLAGGAVAQAGDQLLQLAREAAADRLEASPDDIVLSEGGRFHVAGTPSRSVGWADLGPLRTEADYLQRGPTFPSGCHAAVVEVDRETGKVTLLRFAAVDDCGTVVNPVVVAGQQHGGIVQGVAQALWEEVVHDADGTPLTATFADYAIPSAAELPSIDARTHQSPSPVNALGAKGIGQSGAIGSTVAVQNAVCDAIGGGHVDLPLTPERVFHAMMGR